MAGVAGYDPEALPVAHGHELSPDLHRLLRSRPPVRALRWAASAFGPGARVVRSAARKGGTSSAIHVLDVDTGAGALHRAVLRRYVRPEVMDEALDGLVDREATALRLLSGSGVTAPEVLALDLTGSDAGTPAVLMTLVPGRIDWAPKDLDRFLRRLAKPLLSISEVTVPDDVALPDYRPYEIGRGVGGPSWSSLPARVWERAAEIYEMEPPTTDRLFIHRDFHPGNVLWQLGVVRGVVDWQNASIGSPEADVGHCRGNLHGHFGAAAADRFLEHWLELSGRSEYHPYWDLASAMRVPGSYGPPTAAIDSFIAAAAARL